MIAVDFLTEKEILIYFVPWNTAMVAGCGGGSNLGPGKNCILLWNPFFSLWYTALFTISCKNARDMLVSSN